MRWLAKALAALLVCASAYAGTAYEYDTVTGGIAQEVYSYKSGGGGYISFPVTQVVWWYEITDGLAADNIVPMSISSQTAGGDYTWFYLGIDGGSKYDRIDYHIENTGGAGAACGSFEGWASDSGTGHWTLAGIWGADSSHPTTPGDCGGFLMRKDTDTEVAKTSADTLNGGFDAAENAQIGLFANSATAAFWDPRQAGYLDGFAFYSIVLDDGHKDDLYNGLPAMFVATYALENCYYAGLGGGISKDMAGGNNDFDTKQDIFESTDGIQPPFFWPMGGN